MIDIVLFYEGYVLYGGEGWLGFPDLSSGQKPWRNFVEFRWSPEGPVNQNHSPHLHVDAPGMFSDLLMSVKER